MTLCDVLQLKCRCIKTLSEIAFRLKNKWASCLALRSIPQISHYVHTNISESENI